LKYDNNSNIITISADELASYAFRYDNQRSRSDKFGFQKSNSYINDENVDVSRKDNYLEKITHYDNVSIRVNGYADSISYDGILHSIETIKKVTYISNEHSPLSSPETFAKTCILAYLYINQENLLDIKIKISYIKTSSGEKVTYAAKFSDQMLKRMFDGLVERAFDFIKIYHQNNTLLLKELQEMPFPYHSIREGQEEFIKTAFRTIRHGDTLVASAPTGIGKTMSAIFPALKAVGNNYVDKIFYFTAKNVTGISALEAAAKITPYAKHLRALMVYAKDQLCIRDKDSSQARFECRFCINKNSIYNDITKNEISYKERELSALRNLLDSDDHIYTALRVRKTAKEFNVCPYELALDLSEYCQIIVCDYNYIIDENIRFKRYFKNPSSDLRFAFLFDESHNLPDRVRTTYSAVLTSDSVNDLLHKLSQSELCDSELISAVNTLSEALTSIRNKCTDHEISRTEDDGEHMIGYYESQAVPDELVTSVNHISRMLGKIISVNTEVSQELQSTQNTLSHFAMAASFFDDKFRFLATRDNHNISAEIICVDPSGIINNMLVKARGNILFSATLAPIEYFKDVTGQQDADTLDLPSPYEQDNLCVIAYDSISTRLLDRRSSVDECANVIAEIISAKEGKYLVYFPAYDYMKRVCIAFSKIMPNVDIVIQRQGMSYRERERFIGVFHDKTFESVVGFCVLGGVFSEGIDLSGESLIGSIIVGIGMPQLSAERNIIASYYNEKTERGHEFAYIYPGMVKVMQAAGRVIRSENDHGIIVIIDDRMKDPHMMTLLPPHWKHIKYTGDTYSLGVILSNFWEHFDSK